MSTCFSLCVGDRPLPSKSLWCKIALLSFWHAEVGVQPAVLDTLFMRLSTEILHVGSEWIFFVVEGKVQGVSEYVL